MLSVFGELGLEPTRPASVVQCQLGPDQLGPTRFQRSQAFFVQEIVMLFENVSCCIYILSYHFQYIWNLHHVAADLIYRPVMIRSRRVISSLFVTILITDDFLLQYCQLILRGSFIAEVKLPFFLKLKDLKFLF